MDLLGYRLVEHGQVVQAEYLRAYYGMDQPYYIQYLKWVSGFPKLEFGHSFLKRGTSSGQSVKVTEIIQDRLWMTMILTGVTILFTFLVSFPIGIYSAVRHNSIGDYTTTFIGFIGISVPDFLLAVVLMFIFFAYLGNEHEPRNSGLRRINKLLYITRCKDCHDIV